MILKNTNNTRILVRKMCILLYFIHAPPVFSILAEDEKLPPSRMSFVPMAFRNLMLRGCTA